MPADFEFLQTIANNPDDDACRLVYADWLEEQSDARGEYLRLQVESKRMLARLRELRSQLEPGWLAAAAANELPTDSKAGVEPDTRSGPTSVVEAVRESSRRCNRYLLLCTALVWPGYFL